MLRLADFSGRWRFTRRIEGQGNAPGRLFDGIAEFRPAAGGLIYREAGEARLGGRAAQLLWRAGDRQGESGVDLCFADGSDFHHLDLRTPVATAWHQAGASRHELSYNFTRWPQWRAIWRLRDAASDTTMLTDYRR